MSLLWLLVLTFSSSVSVVTAGSCAGASSAGTLLPEDDIYHDVTKRNPVELECILDREKELHQGKNASHLAFLLHGKKVPRARVSVVNSTAIKLIIEDVSTPRKELYSCVVEDTDHDIGICQRFVYFGYPPLRAENFSCISNNWENLTCTWDVPANPVETSYVVKYSNSKYPIFKCPEPRPKPNMCFWSIRTEPIYMKLYPVYNFRIIGRNNLGVDFWKESNFPHFQHVKPGRAKKLTSVAVSHDVVLLYWEIPDALLEFGPGLVQKVRYRAAYDPEGDWQVADTSMLPKHDASYNLTLNNLQYAFTVYRIEVSMRSAVANETNAELWSQKAFTSVQTLQTYPGAPPRTEVGSFEIVAELQKRSIYVYWKQIPEYLENGAHFHYTVTAVNEEGRKDIVPQRVTRAYAMFTDMSNNHYKFIIHSENDIGPSKNFSTVIVPNRSELPGEPLSFTKIAFNKTFYELSWFPPKNSYRIESYTVFWCQNDRDRPYQCEGQLYWTNLDKSKTRINVTVPTEEQYQFSVAANTKDSSSGMVWATCTVIYNKVVGKMKEKDIEIMQIGERSIRIRWKLDCSDRIGIVEGYRIYYCPILSSRDITNCTDAENNVTTSWNVTSYTLTGLQPYTYYMMAISVITRAGEGLVSDPKVNRTAEAAPLDPPQFVKVSNVTNTSMAVQWQAPKFLNGILRSFIIYYNNKKTPPIPPDAVNGEFMYKLEKLSSYINYTVRVQACTVKCSPKSLPVYQKTKIGVPSQLDAPAVSFINVSMVLVQWKVPNNPAGPVDNYEVMGIEFNDEENKTETQIVKGSEHKVIFKIPDCSKEEFDQRYGFLVRAVNKGPNQEVLPGQWSLMAEESCLTSEMQQESDIIIIILSIAVALLILICLVYYLVKWYKDEKLKWSVTMPRGLDPERSSVAGCDEFKSGFIDHDNNSKMMFNRMHSEICDDEKKRHASGDTRISTDSQEELLLQAKDDRHGRNLSGDSSGCSSGHDSVSSSLTNHTHLSSDSGTEVDQHPSSPDAVFDENPFEKGEKVHGSVLRHRPLSLSRLDEYPELKPTTTDAYMKLGQYFPDQNKIQGVLANLKDHYNLGSTPNIRKVGKEDKFSIAKDLAKSTPNLNHLVSMQQVGQPIGQLRMQPSAGWNSRPHNGDSVEDWGNFGQLQDPYHHYTKFGITATHPARFGPTPVNSLPAGTSPSLGYCKVGLMDQMMKGSPEKQNAVPRVQPVGGYVTLPGADRNEPRNTQRTEGGAGKEKGQVLFDQPWHEGKDVDTSATSPNKWYVTVGQALGRNNLYAPSTEQTYNQRDYVEDDTLPESYCRVALDESSPNNKSSNVVDKQMKPNVWDPTLSPSMSPGTRNYITMSNIPDSNNISPPPIGSTSPVHKLHPSKSSSGYVSIGDTWAERQEPPNSKDSGGDGIGGGRDIQSAPAEAGHRGYVTCNMDTARPHTSQGYVCPSAVQLQDLDSKHSCTPEVDQQVYSGYVSSDKLGPSKDPIVMSPKKLQVQTKEPYTKVVTVSTNGQLNGPSSSLV